MFCRQRKFSKEETHTSFLRLSYNMESLYPLDVSYNALLICRLNLEKNLYILKKMAKTLLKLLCRKKAQKYTEYLIISVC